MPDPNPDALRFLQTRRSRPAKTLAGPVPDRAALIPLLTAAARSPDHGKLEPWRFIVLETPAMARLAEVVQTRVARLWPCLRNRSSKDVASLIKAVLRLSWSKFKNRPRKFRHWNKPMRQALCVWRC